MTITERGKTFTTNTKIIAPKAVASRLPSIFSRARETPVALAFDLSRVFATTSIYFVGNAARFLWAQNLLVLERKRESHPQLLSPVRFVIFVWVSDADDTFKILHEFLFWIFFHYSITLSIVFMSNASMMKMLDSTLF